MKKILAVIMVLSMIMAPFMTISVGAEGLSFSTTAGYDDYYSIKTADDIAKIASYVAEDTNGTNKYYIEKDIELAAKDTSYIPEFKGILNGGDHTITLTIDTENTSGDAAFIGTVYEDSIVENVKVAGTINAPNLSGAVAGVVGTVKKNAGKGTMTYIRNCESSVTISALIGIAGVVNTVEDDINCTIENCVNLGNITATRVGQYTGRRVAGIAVSIHNNTTVTKCVNYGTLYANDSYVAGIVYSGGQHENAKVIGCVNYGILKGPGSNGGIVGSVQKYQLQDCIFAGSINAKTLASSCGIAIDNTAAGTGSMVDCLSIGDYTATTAGTYAYAVSSDAQLEKYATFSGNIYKEHALTVDATDENYQSTKYTTAAEAIEKLNKDISNGIIYAMPPEDVIYDYPVISGVKLITKNVTFNVGDGSVNKPVNSKAILGRSGTFTITPPTNYTVDTVTATTASGSTVLTAVEGTTYKLENVTEDTKITAAYKFDIDSALDKDGNGYYEINDKTELGYINECPNEKYILMSNIDLDPITTSSYITEFSGEFNGNEKIVTIDIDTDSDDGLVGLFGILRENAIIENLIVDGSISALASTNAGGIVGQAVMSTSAGTRAYIRNCENRASVASQNGAAGILGNSSGDIILTVENCVNKGNISVHYNPDVRYSGRKTGGIMCEMARNTRVEKCVNYGHVYAEDGYASGIVHFGGYRITSALVRGCVNYGTVEAAGSVGGIMGYPSHVSIEDCINAGTIIADTGAAVSGISYEIPGNYKVNIIDCLNIGTFKIKDGTKAQAILPSSFESKLQTFSGNMYLANDTVEDLLTSKSTIYEDINAAITALNTNATNGFLYAKAPSDITYDYPVISDTTLATKNVTFDVTGNGSVDIGTDNVAKVIMGTSVPFKVTADEDNYIETVRLAGKPLAGYVATPVTLVTPSVTDDITYVITFAAEDAPVATVTTSLVNPDVFVENGAKVKYMFARLAKDFGEFGMLITTEDLGDTMTVETPGVKKAKGVTAPNVLGQFGIRFVGGAKGAETDLPAGKYYVRPYAIYNGITKYGDVVPFEVK